MYLNRRQAFLSRFTILTLLLGLLVTKCREVEFPDDSFSLGGLCGRESFLWDIMIDFHIIVVI